MKDDERNQNDKLSDIEKAEKTKKDLEKLLEELQEKMDETNQGVKIIKVKVPTKKERIFNLIMNYIVSFFIICGLSGYIDWINYEYFYYVLILSASIPLVEMLLEFIIEKFFFKYILKTFGVILIVPTLISFFSLVFLLPFINLDSTFLTILVIIIYIIVRKVLMSFIKNINGKQVM